jgi:hypothetical protein
VPAKRPDEAALAGEVLDDVLAVGGVVPVSEARAEAAERLGDPDGRDPMGGIPDL